MQIIQHFFTCKYYVIDVTNYLYNMNTSFYFKLINYKRFYVFYKLFIRVRVNKTWFIVYSVQYSVVNLMEKTVVKNLTY